MPQLAVPIMILGTLASAGTQIASGVKAKKQGRENKRRLEREAAEAKADRLRQGRFLTDAQRSMFIAGGVDLSSPTAIDVMASTAAYEARAAERAANPYLQEGRAQSLYGSQAFGAGMIGAGTTALSGASAFAMTRGS